MSTSIHVAIEQRQVAGWVNIHAEPDINWNPKVGTPFCALSWQNYDLFGFLAGVRRSPLSNPIAAGRGLPDDTTEETLDAIAPYSSAMLGGGYGGWSHPEPTTPNERAAESGSEHELYGFSWVGLEELLSVDYDQVIQTEHGDPATCRDKLGTWYFKNLDDLSKLKQKGGIRLLFCFTG